MNYKVCGSTGRGQSYSDEKGNGWFYERDHGNSFNDMRQEEKDWSQEEELLYMRYSIKDRHQESFQFA